MQVHEHRTYVTKSSFLRWAHDANVSYEITGTSGCAYSKCSGHKKPTSEPVYVAGASAGLRHATEKMLTRTDEPHTLQGSTRLRAIAGEQHRIIKRSAQYCTTGANKENTTD